MGLAIQYSSSIQFCNFFFSQVLGVSTSVLREICAFDYVEGVLYQFLVSIPKQFAEHSIHVWTTCDPEKPVAMVVYLFMMQCSDFIYFIPGARQKKKAYMTELD